MLIGLGASRFRLSILLLDFLCGTSLSLRLAFLLVTLLACDSEARFAYSTFVCFIVVLLQLADSNRMFSGVYGENTLLMPSLARREHSQIQREWPGRASYQN